MDPQAHAEPRTERAHQQALRVRRAAVQLLDPLDTAAQPSDPLTDTRRPPVGPAGAQVSPQELLQGQAKLEAGSDQNGADKGGEGAAGVGAAALDGVTSVVPTGEDISDLLDQLVDEDEEP